MISNGSNCSCSRQLGENREREERERRAATEEAAAEVSEQRAYEKFLAQERQRLGQVPYRPQVLHFHFKFNLN